MNKRIKKRYRVERTNIVLEHIKANINIYIIILALFLVGLFIGVIITNNLQDKELQNIKEYLNNSITLLKNGFKLSKEQSIKYSIIKNFLIVFIIWALGLTFFGKYLLYIATLVLGITFGYTTSAIMLTFNFGQSLLLFLSTLFLQNIIAIPTLIFLCAQGIKCHSNFSRTQNIKYILVNFTSYAIISALPLFLSSLIEVYVSNCIVYVVIKYL